MTDKDIFLKSVIAYGLDKRPFELRFLKGARRGIEYGYFDDISKAYASIKDYWHKYTCYFSLQEISPDTLARCNNHIEITKTTTSDSDVLNYIFLHVDVDPVRISGIQSTDEESRIAYSRLKRIVMFLQETLGFPEPIVVFSGNGVTADYRIQRIQANEENKNLIHCCLKALDALYSDKKAVIDTTVYNPSRIIKLPGTISAKGSNTVERPYRFSEILSMPDILQEVSKSQLEELASIQEGLYG